MTKIVLLDFDGVLNNNDFLRETQKAFPGVRSFSMEIGLAMLDPVRCARVQSLCDRTGAQIVLVTGWRKWASQEDLTSLLVQRGLTTPVVGMVEGVRFSGDLRASATDEWLKAHPEVTHYVILDDDVFHWDGFNKRSKWAPFLVAPRDGIEDVHVEEALAILNRE